MSNVILTGKFSLGVQFVVGALDTFALTLPRSRDILLRDLLHLWRFKTPITGIKKIRSKINIQGYTLSMVLLYPLLKEVKNVICDKTQPVSPFVLTTSSLDSGY